MRVRHHPQLRKVVVSKKLGAIWLPNLDQRTLELKMDPKVQITKTRFVLDGRRQGELVTLVKGLT